MIKLESVILENLRKTKIFFDDQLIDETRKRFFTETDVTSYVEKNKLDCVYFVLLEYPVADELRMFSFKCLVEHIINKTIKITEKMKTIFYELLDPAQKDYRFFKLDKKNYIVKINEKNLKIVRAYSCRINNENYLVYQEFNGAAYNYSRIFENYFSTVILKVENSYDFNYNKNVVIDFSEFEKNLSKKEFIKLMKAHIEQDKKDSTS